MGDECCPNGTSIGQREIILAFLNQAECRDLSSKKSWKRAYRFISPSWTEACSRTAPDIVSL